MVDREELDGAEIISAPKMNEQVNAVRWTTGLTLCLCIPRNVLCSIDFKRKQTIDQSSKSRKETETCLREASGVLHYNSCVGTATSHP